MAYTELTPTAGYWMGMNYDDSYFQESAPDLIDGVLYGTYEYGAPDGWWWNSSPLPGGPGIRCNGASNVTRIVVRCHAQFACGGGIPVTVSGWHGTNNFGLYATDEENYWHQVESFSNPTFIHNDLWECAFEYVFEEPLSADTFAIMGTRPYVDLVDDYGYGYDSYILRVNEIELYTGEEEPEEPSADVYPTLPGLTCSVIKKPAWSTIVHESGSGTEFRLGRMTYPRWKWELTYEFLRTTTTYPEMQELLAFINAHRGSLETFTFNDPDDGGEYTVRFEEDEIEFEKFMDGLWAVKKVGLISTAGPALEDPSVTDIYPTLPGLTFSKLRTPIWNAVVQESVSGSEYRLSRWTYPRWKWELTYEFLRDASAYEEMQSLLEFLNYQKGRLTQFRFKDPDDYTVTDESIGTGDGSTTAWQMTRTIYKAGSVHADFIEPIKSIDLTSTYKIYLDAVEQSSSDYAVTADGILTFDTAPADGAAITADFSYYWPVRFEDDEIEFEKFMDGLWAVKKVGLISIK